MKAFCIGRNYVEHVTELHHQIPQRPIVFIKHADCFFKEADAVSFSSFSNDIHYEAELVFRFSTSIDKPLSPHQSEVFNYVDGVSIGLDLTARDVQQYLKEKGLPWEKAKSFRQSAFVGKWFSINQELLENDFVFDFAINRNVVQLGDTRKMIFKLHELIAEISLYFPIKKGDLLFTGTPSGVGKLEMNSHLKATLNGETAFDFELK